VALCAEGGREPAYNIRQMSEIDSPRRRYVPDSPQAPTVVLSTLYKPVQPARARALIKASIVKRTVILQMGLRRPHADTFLAI
jgi:hypothetical protein